MKKIIIIVAIVIAIIVAAGGLFYWNEYRKFLKVEVVQFDPQLKIYVGAGNSIILTSKDGTQALVVDTKMGKAAEELRADIKAKDVIIVNTHTHIDHTGGNSLYPGAKIISGAFSSEQWAKETKKSRYPDQTLKQGEEILIKIDDEKVHVRNMGRAQTWNDTVVYCENRKLLVTGDIVFVNMHPSTLKESGSNVASWIGVLDSLQKKYDVKTLVPGHGKVSDKAALIVMKDYFVSISNAVGSPEKLAEVKNKYNNWYSIPGMIGFDKVAQYVEAEKKGN